MSAYLRYVLVTLTETLGFDGCDRLKLIEERILGQSGRKSGIREAPLNAIRETRISRLTRIYKIDMFCFFCFIFPTHHQFFFHITLFALESMITEIKFARAVYYQPLPKLHCNVEFKKTSLCGMVKELFSSVKMVNLSIATTYKHCLANISYEKLYCQL